MSNFLHAPIYDRSGASWFVRCACGWTENQGRPYTTLALARAAHNGHLVARGLTAWTY
jgi:hypothetical protein